MSARVREACEDDLDAVIEMTAANRRLLAGEALLPSRLGHADARGDVAAIVVVDEPDRELPAILDGLDARHPVDLYGWP